MSRFLSSSSGADISSPNHAVLTSRHLPIAVAATVPAVLLLALVGATARAPFDANALPPSLTSTNTSTGQPQPSALVRSDSDLVAMAQRGQWPIAETILARPAAATTPAVLPQLRGRLEPMPPIRGKAPLAGQVSRVAVKVGQSVSVNDTVLELSAGPDSRANQTGSRAERRQTAAESAQVQAANEQAKLQQKMRAAQEQLAASQDRVAKAQQRVDAAREIVRRLQRGETVTAAESVATQPKGAARDATPRDASADSARRQALIAAQDAQKTARSAQWKSGEAERRAVALEAKAKAAATASKDTTAAAAAAQKNFDAGTIKASALDAARAAAEDAENLSKWATNAAGNARKTADSLAAASRDAQVEADNASAGVKRSLNNVSVFGSGEKPREAVAETPARAAGGTLSVDDAARLARAAVEESETAVEQARQLKQRVDTYARQVNATRSDLDSSSKRLASAQDAVLDQTITANLSTVRAPASGVVESVAAIAQTVKPGDVIVAIGKLDQMRVVWTDSTGAWRKLHEDTRIPAVINAPGGDRTVSVQIEKIEQVGGSARIEGVVDNPMTDKARALQPGIAVSAFVPGAPGATAPSAAASQSAASPTSVPAEAVVDVYNQLPSAASMADPAVAAKAAAEEAARRVAVLVPVAGAGTYRIEWRRVAEISRNRSGVRVTGLMPGERIALRPALLPQGAAALQLVG